MVVCGLERERQRESQPSHYKEDTHDGCSSTDQRTDLYYRQTGEERKECIWRTDTYFSTANMAEIV